MVGYLLNACVLSCKKKKDNVVYLMELLDLWFDIISITSKLCDETKDGVWVFFSFVIMCY